jgi:Mrp family chromosome partitioning ATPase
MVTLSRNIDALLPDTPRKMIQFIGSQPGEGTSTVIRDFAMVSADRFGKSVLLPDADPRRPSQHLFFRLQPQFGWGEISLSRYVDGVVLVLEAEKTRKPVAENLKNRILENGGNLLGMVFNNRRFHIPESVYKRL